MDAEGERWFGPGEMADRLGVTTKALRVYEREGLITPGRTEAGWRVYGPAHVTRLHQIIALKDLGLPLKTMKGLIGGDQDGLRTVLYLQHEALEEQRRKIDRGLDLLTRARRKLIAGETLSLDDVTSLTRETMLQTPALNRRFKERFDELLTARLPGGEAAAVFEDMRRMVEATGKSPAKLASELDAMMSEARLLMASGDPDSEAAKAMLRRWLQATQGMSAPDQPVRDAVKGALLEAMADPDLAEGSLYDADVMAFIQSVSRGMNARGELSLGASA
jgi:DNA-binding transcriptional MerR regulator